MNRKEEKTKKKINIKNKKGITLIALVITIIVLLILAGISKGAITGDNGIINQAHNAKEDTEIAQWEEQIDVAIIDAESKNRNLSINDVIDELKNKDIIDDESQVNKETGAITTNEPSYIIEDKLNDYIVILAEDKLKDGDYVNYVDKNGATRLCCVLWDNTSGYGTQIITMDTVEDVELGNGTGSYYENNQTYFDIALKSYNDAIVTLNTKSMNYLNKTFATDARSVGTIPNDKESEGGYLQKSESWFLKYNNKIKNYDNNRKLDVAQLNKLQINGIGKKYWLASRNTTGEVNGIAFLIGYFSENGSNFIGSSPIRILNSGNRLSSWSIIYGLRPVFTLKPNVKIIGGTGSVDDPYILGI